MKSFLKLLGSLIIISVVSACQTTNTVPTLTPDSEPASGVNTSAALLEPLEGGLVARALGKTPPRNDGALALQNEYRALEYTAPGEAVLWQGEQINGRIVPSQPYRVGSQDCRQYEHTINDRASQTTVRGTACRNEDGSWSLLS